MSSKYLPWGCKPLQTSGLRLWVAALLKTHVALQYNSQRVKVCARSRIQRACIGSNHHNTRVGSLFFFFAYLCAHVAPETLVQVSSFRSVERKGWKRIWTHAHSAQYVWWEWPVFRLSFKRRITGWLWIQINRNCKYGRRLNGMNERMRTSGEKGLKRWMKSHTADTLPWWFNHCASVKT